MRDYDDGLLEGHDLPRRTVRALTEYLTVIPEGGDVYTVVSQSGREYRVDLREGRCTCPDAEHNLNDGELCKRARRCRFEMGRDAIPAWIDPDALPSDFAAHVGACPRVAATDGGTSLAGDATGVEESTETSETAGRPDDCGCTPLMDDLPCWPCWRDGFRQPNPNATRDKE
jgi:hypothetical protein